MSWFNDPLEWYLFWIRSEREREREREIKWYGIRMYYETTCLLLVNVDKDMRQRYERLIYYTKVIPQINSPFILFHERRWRWWHSCRGDLIRMRHHQNCVEGVICLHARNNSIMISIQQFIMLYQFLSPFWYQNASV